MRFHLKMISLPPPSLPLSLPATVLIAKPSHTAAMVGQEQWRWDTDGTALGGGNIMHLLRMLRQQQAEGLSHLYDT